MKVDVLLQRRQVDDAVGAHVVGVVGDHHFARALSDSAQAGGAHEHVMGLFTQHELACPAERIERRLGECAELVLAVAVSEVGERQEREPVGRLLVERIQDAGIVGIARVPLQQGLGLLPPVAAEVGVEQVHHRPQMAAFLDVDLEEVAQVIQRRGGVAEVSLLFHRRRLGVALHHDQPAQVAAELAGHLLPDRRSHRLAEADAAVGLGRGQEYAPAVVGHLHVVEMGPAFGTGVGSGAQVHVIARETGGSQFVPPASELGLPALQRSLEPPVLREADVVGNALAVVDLAHERLPPSPRRLTLGPERLVSPVAYG